MKKYVLPIVAVVLIVAALISPSEILFPTVSAGPGNGENEEIKSIAELSDVLGFIIDRKQADEDGRFLFNFGEDYDFLRLASDGDESGTEGKRSTNKYSSLTLTEDTVIDSHIVQQVIVGYTDPFYDNFEYIPPKPIYAEASSTVYMNRSLVAYFTEDASYYESKGRLNSNSVIPNEGESATSFYFDLQIYLSEDFSLVRFNTFNLSSETNGESNEDDVKINQSMLRRWVRLPAEAAEYIFNLVDAMNRNTLEQVLGMMDRKGFEQSGDRYTYKTATYIEDDTEISVDLSNDENPCIEMSIDYGNDREISNGDGKDNDTEGPGIIGGSRMTMNDRILFSNINNTVIKVKSDEAMEFDSVEDFENKMFIK